jgi:hypothetical protein
MEHRHLLTVFERLNRDKPLCTYRRTITYYDFNPTKLNTNLEIPSKYMCLVYSTSA